MDLKEGKRICLGPYRGTIRYRGPVPPSAGEWLGIEWDDPSRGKHDGTSADGTRYFHVRVPGSGSFIRPTSTKLSSGCSFLEALRNKYLPASEPQPTPQQDQHQYTRKTLGDIEIEAPNLDRIAKRAARLDRLKEVGLGGWQQSSHSAVDAGAVDDSHYDVARAFDEQKGEGEGSIRVVCPNIRWLDLSRSLLSDWEEVSLIAGELESLQTLLLQFNRLQAPPEQVPESWRTRLSHVQDLRLDGALISWEEVMRLAPALSGLRHLQLGSNQITALNKQDRDEVGAALLPSLTSLSLEDNHISSWPDLIAALGCLASLESLNLNRNRIATIPTAPASAPKLPRLRELHLRSNQLDSWSSLEHIVQWLGHEDGLSALHISTVLDEGDPSSSPGAAAAGGLLGRYEYRDFRAIAIARLPSLTVLDKTEITPKQRRDAELFVYTRFRDGDAHIINGTAPHDSDEKLVLSLEETVARFPRFLELAKLFDGEDAMLLARREEPAKSTKKNTLRSKMITLTVIASDTAPSGSKPHVGTTGGGAEVKILASTPLRLAKSKLAAAVGMKPSQVGQVWALLKPSAGGESPGADEDRIVLEVDDMSRNLEWYEVSSGDQLVLVTEA